MVCTFRRAFPLTHYGNMGCQVSEGGMQNFFKNYAKYQRKLFHFVNVDNPELSIFVLKINGIVLSGVHFRLHIIAVWVVKFPREG